MNELQILDQRELLGKDFRIYGTVEEPLFLARDVAEWIDYQKISGKNVRNTSKMLKMVDEDEKVKAILSITNKDTQVRHGGFRENTEMWFLTEDGLYEVLMQSRKPIAKQFKKKVKEILKGLRKGELKLVKSKEDELVLAIYHSTGIDAVNKAKELTELKVQEATKPLKEKIAEDKPKVDVYERFLNSDFTYTATDLKGIFGFPSAKAMNKKLHELKLIYKPGNSKDWTAYKDTPTEWYKVLPTKYGAYLKWTSKGILGIAELLDKKLSAEDIENLINEDGVK